MGKVKISELLRCLSIRDASVCFGRSYRENALPDASLEPSCGKYKERATRHATILQP
jgi:hypothetical protein